MAYQLFSPQLHPFCQQRPIVQYCREHNIVVQAYCPIIRGKMDHPQITALATKSATPTRIHSNAEVYDFVLADEDVAALDSLDRGKDGAVSWNPVNAD
ncbi:hypothetical protein C0991_001633 [Blastosporella zonata]|nr:hypothetical protein C0991_001633 [Blastosporella zonata]